MDIQFGIMRVIAGMKKSSGENTVKQSGQMGDQEVRK
jgi:hypothetical protein